MKNNSIQLSSLVAFSLLGPAYFTGSEWLTFFSYFGSWGSIGLFISCLALTWLLYRIALFASVRQLTSLAELIQFMMGPQISQTVIFLLYALLAALGGVVIGQEAMELSLVSRISPLWCGALLIGVLFFCLRQGAQNVSALISCLLAFSLLTFGGLLAFGSYLSIPAFTYQLNINWLWHAVLFIALHLILSLAILLPVFASSSGISSSASAGIWIGGVGFAVIATLLHLLILAHWHDVHHSAEPLFLIISSVFPSGALPYQLVSLAQSLLFISLLYRGIMLPMADRYQLELLPLQLLWMLMTFAFSLLPLFAGWAADGTYIGLTYVGLYVLVLLLYKRV